VEADEGKHQALQVLHEVVEAAQPIRVLGVVDVDEGAYLGGGEGDVFLPYDNLQLLAPHAVRLRPEGVVLLHDLGVVDDPPQLLHDGAHHICLFPNHNVILVVGIISIPEFSVWSQLKLQELVPELPFVANIVA